MVCSLAGILVLGLFSSAAGLATSTGVDATMVQVTRQCGSEDFEGVVEALTKYGHPLGYDHGKSLLRTCFTNSEGECMLGTTQCAWIKKCLMAEGPCEQIPIEETFAEMPFGKEALIEMMSKFNITENTTHVNVPVSMLIETATNALKKATANQTNQVQLKSTASTELEGAPVKGQSHRRRQPSNKVAIEKAEQEWRAASKKAMNRWPGERRFHNFLWRLNNARMTYFRDFPEDSQRKWVYNVFAFAAYLLAGCATTFASVKTTGWGTHQSPVYTHYAPLGVGQNAEYVGPIYKTNLIFNPNEWTCNTGTRTYKKHIWENMYGRVGWPNPSSAEGYIPRYPGMAGR